MSRSIEYRAAGPVVTIWLNRPEARNAYDLEMMRSLRRALARAERDETVRVIVVRGRGESFCVGADVAMLDSGHPWADLSAFVVATFDKLAESRKVSIAAVHGYAIAGGFELMLACDFVVAAADARIGDFHIRNGLFGSAGPIYRLPRMIGLRRAKELMLSGDVLSGTQAHEWGLVNAAAPAADLDLALTRFLARFTDKSPTISWLTKLALGRGMDADTESLKVLERMIAGLVEMTPDAHEGLAALAAKRPPKWPPLRPPID